MVFTRENHVDANYKCLVTCKAHVTRNKMLIQMSKNNVEYSVTRDLTMDVLLFMFNVFHM